MFAVLIANFFFYLDVVSAIVKVSHLMKPMTQANIFIDKVFYCSQKKGLKYNPIFIEFLTLKSLTLFFSLEYSILNFQCLKRKSKLEMQEKADKDKIDNTTITIQYRIRTAVGCFKCSQQQEWESVCSRCFFCLFFTITLKV